MFNDPSPFKRLIIDHYIRGQTRVQWVLDASFSDPLPHTFQLQFGRTPSNGSTDWQDVGAPVVNGVFAIDDDQHLFGKRLLTHYRVKLTTPTRTYLSSPQPVYGELDNRDWRLAREVVRKELLRHRFASRSGTVLKRLRYGQRCAKCRDLLTEELQNTTCGECYGTGFIGGYHPPIRMQLFDVDPELIREDKDNRMRGTIRDVQVKARAIGCIQLNKYDVWVDDHSDQRWIIHDIQHASEIRGVPLVFIVTMRLAPYSDPVYSVEVGGEDAELAGPVLPVVKVGDGDIPVNHDFGGADNLAYVTTISDEGSGDDCDGDTREAGVLGASVKIFCKADWDAGRREDEFVVASSTITANGRWSSTVLLQPGQYVLQFEKPGEVGPDIAEITVTAPATSESSSSSSSAPAQSESSSSSSSASSISSSLGV